MYFLQFVPPPCHKYTFTKSSFNYSSIPKIYPSSNDDLLLLHLHFFFLFFFFKFLYPRHRRCASVERIVRVQEISSLIASTKTLGYQDLPSSRNRGLHWILSSSLLFQPLMIARSKPYPTYFGLTRVFRQKLLSEEQKKYCL